MVLLSSQSMRRPWSSVLGPTRWCDQGHLPRRPVRRHLIKHEAGLRASRASSMGPTTMRRGGTEVTRDPVRSLQPRRRPSSGESTEGKMARVWLARPTVLAPLTDDHGSGSSSQRRSAAPSLRREVMPVRPPGPTDPPRREGRAPVVAVLLAAIAVPFLMPQHFVPDPFLARASGLGRADRHHAQRQSGTHRRSVASSALCQHWHRTHAHRRHRLGYDRAHPTISSTGMPR